MAVKYDVLVIGSGPGGYVAAIRASQLGMKVGVVERAELGGICLNWGCIPTKALLKSANVFEYINHAADYGIKVAAPQADAAAMVKRSREVANGMSKGIQFLLRKNKIDHIQGFGKLATGARSRELPNLPQDGKKIIGYREALVLDKVPSKMVVVGSGAIGVEFAYYYSTIGCEVTIVEFLPNIVPNEDEEVSKALEKSFKKKGINIMTNSAVESVDTKGKGCKVKVKTAKGEETIDCDVVFSAVGIQTNLEGIGLEDVGIATDKGRVLVDDYYKVFY